MSVILTKAPSTDKLQFYINFSDTVWIAAASMGAVGASEGGGRNGGWSGRCEGGGAVVVGREADEGPKENGGRACSATVRHAGICPAAAAGSEDDDRTGERTIVYVFQTRRINRLAERHVIRIISIPASLILGRRPIYANTTRIESLDVTLQLGGGGRFGSHKAAVQIVPAGRHVVKLADGGQEPAAGTGRGLQRGLPCVVAGRVAVVVQGAVAVGFATPGCLEVAHLPPLAGMGRHIVVYRPAVGIAVPGILIGRDTGPKIILSVWPCYPFCSIGSPCS
ncbi:MAG: hypothetical protein DBY02_10085 [Coprobacter fastidiosus]|nr:MAG: hypothetical protein DBY02_10085 [Coprobacter fastidiosus]